MSESARAAGDVLQAGLKTGAEQAGYGAAMAKKGVVGGAKVAGSVAGSAYGAIADKLNPYNKAIRESLKIANPDDITKERATAIGTILGTLLNEGWITKNDRLTAFKKFMPALIRYLLSLNNQPPKNQ
jgi:hypothetical protein